MMYLGDLPWDNQGGLGGHRRRIGAALATFEISIVLGSLLPQFKLELVDSTIVVPKRRIVTMEPSIRVPIRVRSLH